MSGYNQDGTIEVLVADELAQRALQRRLELQRFLRLARGRIYLLPGSCGSDAWISEPFAELRLAHGKRGGQLEVVPAPNCGVRRQFLWIRSQPFEVAGIELLVKFEDAFAQVGLQDKRRCRNQFGIFELLDAVLLVQYTNRVKLVPNRPATQHQESLGDTLVVNCVLFYRNTEISGIAVVLSLSKTLKTEAR